MHLVYLSVRLREMEQQRFGVKDGLPLTVSVEWFWVFCCSASCLRWFLGFSWWISGLKIKE